VHTHITELLIAHGAGDPEALHRLVPLVYDDLRRLARVQLRRRRPGQTLETTGLVHEAYLRPQMETGRWRISTSGGTSPRWGPDGRELFYVDEEGLMVVPIAQASTFAPARHAGSSRSSHSVAASEPISKCRQTVGDFCSSWRRRQSHQGSRS
jgi:hypothetical protein